MEIADIRKLFRVNNDIMKTSDLYKSGVSKYEVKKLTDSNVLERISKDG